MPLKQSEKAQHGGQCYRGKNCREKERIRGRPLKHIEFLRHDVDIHADREAAEEAHGLKFRSREPHQASEKEYDNRLHTELQNRDKAGRFKVGSELILGKTDTNREERDRGGGVCHQIDSFLQRYRHLESRETPEKTENNADHNRVPKGSHRALIDRLGE